METHNNRWKNYKQRDCDVNKWQKENGNARYGIYRQDNREKDNEMGVTSRTERSRETSNLYSWNKVLDGKGRNMQNFKYILQSFSSKPSTQSSWPSHTNFVLMHAPSPQRNSWTSQAWSANWQISFNTSTLEIEHTSLHTIWIQLKV